MCQFYSHLFHLFYNNNLFFFLFFSANQFLLRKFRLARIFSLIYIVCFSCLYIIQSFHFNILMNPAIILSDISQKIPFFFYLFRISFYSFHIPTSFTFQFFLPSFETQIYGPFLTSFHPSFLPRQSYSLLQICG